MCTAFLTGHPRGALGDIEQGGGRPGLAAVGQGEGAEETSQCGVKLALRRVYFHRLDGDGRPAVRTCLTPRKSAHPALGSAPCIHVHGLWGRGYGGGGGGAPVCPLAGWLPVSGLTSRANLRTHGPQLTQERGSETE